MPIPRKPKSTISQDDRNRINYVRNELNEACRIADELTIRLQNVFNVMEAMRKEFPNV